MISVLMSVYNETLHEIRQSIDSILSQSYTDFELIIVLDQPEYREGLELLTEYAAKDPRIKLLINEKNIGLALSMNRAAEHAAGRYLLRMDADDICFPDRFRLEYEALVQGNYDLVCGNYDFIDESGNPLPQKVPLYTDKQLSALLPCRNMIHHPTVLMSAEKFRAVGGYRNYPCAQDYDLWLRMKCAGCRMHMLPDKLIKYRVRQASTTGRKRYKQFCTGEYARMLYRQKNNMSGYSHENYLAYLAEHHADDPSANDDFIAHFNLYMDSKQNIKKGHLIRGSAGILNILFRSGYYRPHLLRNLKIFFISKFIK